MPATPAEPPQVEVPPEPAKRSFPVPTGSIERVSGRVTHYKRHQYLRLDALNGGRVFVSGHLLSKSQWDRVREGSVIECDAGTQVGKEELLAARVISVRHPSRFKGVIIEVDEGKHALVKDEAGIVIFIDFAIIPENFWRPMQPGSIVECKVPAENSPGNLRAVKFFEVRYPPGHKRTQN